MRGAQETISAALAAKGFAHVERPALFKSVGTAELSGSRIDLWYFGALQTARGRVSLYLYVPDLSFFQAPQVWLVERPRWLKGWRPHLVGTGNMSIESLCYSDHEQYQLLAHEPDRAMLRVLEDTRITLDRIAVPDSVVDDSKRELARLWPSDFRQIYIDTEPSNTDIVCSTALHEDAKKNIILLVSNDPRRLAAKLGLLGTLKTICNAAIYPEVHESLYLTAKGPPNNVLEIREWLRQVSPQTYSLWHKRLQSLDFFKKDVRLHFFRTTGQVIGFMVEACPDMRGVRSARKIKNFLAKHVYRSPLSVTRLHAERLDETYLVRRNLPASTPDLRGLKVLIIGCGAIGGFLAQSLVQLGAGIPGTTGDGLLTLCDKESIAPGNIGRHALGMQYLGQPKADALKIHLAALRPTAIVESVNDEFHKMEHRIGEFNLILDACGYEVFSRYISKLVRKTDWLKDGHALLHVWIEGRGAVTRCLLQDQAKVPCYDCLWNYGPNIEPVPRDRAYTDTSWNAHEDDGYATMTPFAVSAPLAAAAVAIDAIQAWRAGQPSPRFRSRSAEGKSIAPSLSKDLVKSKGCPGCAT